jgi:hypothetical protein
MPRSLTEAERLAYRPDRFQISVLMVRGGYRDPADFADVRSSNGRVGRVAKR